MSDVIRVSFSLESGLFEHLESLRRTQGYGNRSKFLCDLIRDRLVEERWKGNEEAVGTVTLIYDHHAYRLSDRLVDVQHRHHDVVLATTHVHLDQHMCAEVLLLKGTVKQLRDIASALRREKGVLHSDLSMSTPGDGLR